MIRWLLVDYGEVLSTPVPMATKHELAALAGMDLATFDERYWHFREDYDLGQSAPDYWSRVLDRAVHVGSPLLATLTAVDCDGWLHLNRQTLAAVMSVEQRNAIRLALLSNAPEVLASAIDSSGWSAVFSPRFYSCRLGCAKPDADAFTVVLDALGAGPSEVLFIDDRAVNTAAATALGIATITFTSADALPAAITRAVAAAQ